MRTSLIAIALVGCLSNSAFSQSPLDDPEFPHGSQKIDGAWRRDEIGKVSEVKHFYDGRYLVFQYKPETNVIVWSAFGLFRQDGSSLREKVKFCSTEDLPDRSFSWSLGFAGEGVYSQSSGRTKKVLSRLSNEKDSSTLEGVSDYSSGKSVLDGVWYHPWDKDKACIKVLDKGRIYCLGFTKDKKIMQFFLAGIFSVDAQGVLREKYVYATENRSAYKNSLLLSKATLSSEKKTFEQLLAGGGKETWTRWGNPVK